MCHLDYIAMAVTVKMLRLLILVVVAGKLPFTRSGFVFSIIQL